jgi:colicin import membrane protein
MRKLAAMLLLIAAVVAMQSPSFAQKKETAKGKATEVKAKDTKKGKEALSDDPAVGKTADGKTVYEGAKGGHYYRTDKAEKVYVKEFVGAKIVGKTADGKSIFQGPKGGKFYYNDKGDKVYVKGK